MLKKSKSAQAAMEYLSTYGFAFLVLIIAIGVYFFMTSSISLVPDRIDFGVEVQVPDFSYAYFEFDDFNIGNFEIIVRNAMGVKLEDVSLRIDECNNGNGETSKKFDIQPGETYKIILTCENIETVLNSVNRYHGNLNFRQKTEGNYLNHSRKGEIIVNPSDIINFPDNNKGRFAFAIRNNASGINDKNRFYPCDEVPGCNNPDPSGNLKKIFGGYVDSMTGLVWSNESYRSDLEWSIVDLSNNWDAARYEWDYKTQSYKICEDCVNSNLRNDEIGGAFTYCTNLSENGKSDWKLASIGDYSGLTKCDQCLAPYGKYGTMGGAGLMKFYWTDSDDIERDKATSIVFVNDQDVIASPTSKTANRAIRCVRDN